MEIGSSVFGSPCIIVSTLVGYVAYVAYNKIKLRRASKNKS